VGQRVHARIRHQGALYAAEVTGMEGDRVDLRFTSPARAVVPGQAVVLYDGEDVLGGAWIRRQVGP
jgi:tRNA-specific 2-thiouridylase